MKRTITLFAFILAVLFSMQSPADPQTSTADISPAQIKKFQQIIHDYLIEHPEILVEASQALDIKETAKAEIAVQKAITPLKDKIFNDSHAPVVGNKNGTVFLVEFFDYQCSHCKSMKDIVQNLIQKNPNLKVIFKQLPIFGQESQMAAQAALAAEKQGKFFELHNALLAAEKTLTPEKIWTIAKSVGLNIDQLKKDMGSPDVQNELRENIKLADQLGIPGTPMFIISNKDLSQFKFVPGKAMQEDLQNKLNVLSPKNN